MRRGEEEKGATICQYLYVFWSSLHFLYHTTTDCRHLIPPVRHAFRREDFFGVFCSLHVVYEQRFGIIAVSYTSILLLAQQSSFGTGYAFTERGVASTSFLGCL